MSLERSQHLILLVPNERCHHQVLIEGQDEFFHVPQAQKYCEGDYSWDPMITTPPGLYDHLLQLLSL
jgi:hypothetical protein